MENEKKKWNIVFDFDGVIHSYTSGWKGVTEIPDPPVEGIREVIQELRNDYTVIVVSTRTAELEGRKAVEEWLRNNNIEVDHVTAEKPPALVYIDDRAITFDGDCSTLIEKVKNFKVWNAK